MSNVKCQKLNVDTASGETFKRSLSIASGGTFKRSLWVLVAMLFILLFGCSDQSEPTEPVADEQLRIVSMAPNLTEILFALGLDQEIVGVTRHCNYPPQAQAKRQIGTFWQPDVEAVLASRPTLVIALDFERQQQLAAQLQRVGCTVLTIEDIESTRQLYEGILTIGRAVDRLEQAQEMVERLTAAQEAIRARYAERPPKKVLWVIQRQPLRVAGETTFINELIEIAGGVNAIGPTLHQYPPVSDEKVIATHPDVIIEPANMPEEWQTQARSAGAFYAAFRTLPAVQNNAIHVLDGDLVSRLGPRLDEALDVIAACLWQESP